MLRARTLRFTEGNQVEVFDDGAAGLAAMHEAIQAARRKVHLETYILRADETGLRFLRTLETAARRGVDVRLLFDALGSRGLDRDVLWPLRRAGAQLAEFNPPSRWLPRFAPRRRDHRKILVVDGRTGFVGGLNLGDEYASREGDQPAWRDAHLRVVGPAVRDLEAVFLESWAGFAPTQETWNGGPCWATSRRLRETRAAPCWPTDRSIAVAACASC
jgi:cardiolipin synthase